MTDASVQNFSYTVSTSHANRHLADSVVAWFCSHPPSPPSPHSPEPWNVFMSRYSSACPGQVASSRHPPLSSSSSSSSSSSVATAAPPPRRKRGRSDGGEDEEEGRTREKRPRWCICYMCLLLAEMPMRDLSTLARFFETNL